MSVLNTSLNIFSTLNKLFHNVRILPYVYILYYKREYLFHARACSRVPEIDKLNTFYEISSAETEITFVSYTE